MQQKYKGKVTNESTRHKLKTWKNKGKKVKIKLFGLKFLSFKFIFKICDFFCSFVQLQTNHIVPEKQSKNKN